MADKKISEFGTFTGKQDEETYYVVASGDSSSPAATNYKVPFTDLALQITGDLNLGGGSLVGGSFNFGSTDPANNTSTVNFNQGENVRMYIDESGGVNVSEKLIVADGKETVLGGPVTIKGSTTHEGGLFTTSDTTTTLFKGPNTFGDSTSDITNFLGTTNITGPLNLKDPAFSDQNANPPSPTAGKLYRKGNDLYFGDQKLLTDSSGGGGQWTAVGPDIYFNAGNVGIGVNSPSQPLDVNGRIKCDSITGGSTLSIASGGTGNLNLYAGIFGGTAELGVSIKEGGNVGIGTTSPSRHLTVAGNFRLEKTSADGGHTALDFNVGGGADHPELNIYDKDGTAGVFTIKDGNVGIGTSDPISKLHLAGDSADFKITNAAGLITAALFSNGSHEGAMAIYEQGSPKTLFEAAPGAVNYINNGGNVGIGTDSPNGKLEVNSDDFDTLYLNRNNVTGSASIFMKNNGQTGCVLQSINGGGLQIFNLNNAGVLTPTQTTDSNGNVGIGTTSPDMELHVKSASTDSGIKIEGATQSLRIDQNSIRGLTSNDLSFSTLGHVGQLYLKADGNVGIGTDSPHTALHVGDDVSFSVTDPEARISVYNTDGYSGYSFGEDANNRAGLVWNATNKYAYIFTATSTTTYEENLVLKDGNVGIGTASPGASLDIVNTSSTTSASYGLSVRGGGNSNAGGYSFRALDMDGNTDLFVRGDGYVGIGTATPSYPLDVVGSKDSDCASSFTNTSTTAPHGIRIHLSGVAPDNNASAFMHALDSSATRCIIYSDGDIQNHDNSYGQISDRTLKDNIVDATPKLDDLNNLRVVNFNFKSDLEAGKDHKQIGMIAQEVEEIFPGIVQETELDGETKKGIKYSVLVPMLVKGLQEQQELIEDLKSRIEALEG
jgi:hypothetical protein